MASSAAKAALIQAPVRLLERRIYVLRGQKVMLDEDFVFRLTTAEVRHLRSQVATSSWGGRRTRPLAFTEHGVAMLSAVLNSERAVKMSLAIIRAFVKLREVLASHTELAHRLKRVVLPEPPPKRRIGF